MTVDTYRRDGNKDSEMTLNEAIFGAEPHGHAVYMAVRTMLAHRRQGTSKAKERAEVRGGGKKPWRQKGRGGARAGSSRSPLWVGGGTVFGPRPRTYSLRLPTKVRQLARKSAYAMKALDQQVMIVEDFTVNTPKTREVFEILKALNLHQTKTLLLVAGYDKNLWMAGRNIATLSIMDAANASTYDLLNNQMLLIQKSALPVIEQSFTKIQ